MTRPTIRIAPATQVDGGPRPAKAPPKAALRALLLAPHRLAFFAGGVMLLFASFAWVVWLLLSAAGVSVITALPPTLAHGFAFAAAYMPLFIAGFMFTAGPRWLDVPSPPATALVWPVRLHVAGIVLVLLGTVGSPGTAAFGSLLLAIAWTAIGVAFATLVRSSRARDRLHARCVLAFWIAGIAAALLFAAGLATHQFGVVAAAVWLLVFACVAPITVTVAHRVLPFFTSNAVTTMVPWRPNWVLGLLVAGILLFGSLQVAGRVDLAGAQIHRLADAHYGRADQPRAHRTGRPVGTGPEPARTVAAPGGHAARGLCLDPDCACSGRRRRRAGASGCECAAARTDAAACADYRIPWQHAVRNGDARDQRAWRPCRQRPTRFVWRLFWGLQAAALLRLAAPLSSATSVNLPLAAAVLWTLVWTAWVARYLPILLRPRVDGRPG